MSILARPTGQWCESKADTCGVGSLSSKVVTFSPFNGVGVVSDGEFIGAAPGAISLAIGVSDAGERGLGVAINIAGGQALSLNFEPEEADRLLTELTVIVGQLRQ